MSTRNRADAQKFTHDNFTAATNSGARTLPANTNFVLVDNTGSTNNALVSLDGGVTFKTVRPNTFLSFDCDNLASLYIKSAAATTTVECIYGSEA